MSTAPDQPALAFYTRQIGAPPAGQTTPPARPLSYVAYSLASDNSLQRTALAFDFSTTGSYTTPVGWSPFGATAGNVPSLTQTTPQELCGGVFGFAYTFLQADGSEASAYVPRSSAGQTNANPTFAVRVSLAILETKPCKFSRLRKGRLWPPALPARCPIPLSMAEA